MEKTKINIKEAGIGGSPVLVVMGGHSIQMVVGSNPGTRYWMGIFSHIFVVKIVMCVGRVENK